MIVIEMKFTCHGVFFNNFARESKLSNADPISSKLALAIGLRAKITRSHPGAMLGMRGRNVSRSMRFARLRWTAFPIERPADTANLDLSISFGRAISTTSGWA